MALGRDGVYHHLIAPEKVMRYIIERQWKNLGHNFINHQADCKLISVDTLLARQDTLKNWPDQVKLAQIDEGHHCLADNKWGRALNLFKNAVRIGWTATPIRSDRRSLHAAEGGVYDAMVLGPTPRELLASGYLSPYRVFGPPPSIVTRDVGVTATGDFSPAGLREAAHKSTICGDMVSHYLRLIPGDISIAFLVDVEQAKETAARFTAEGVPAVWMSSKETDDRTRVGNLEALARGDIKVICNVDLLGEGVDVPRVEAVLDGRPTKSLGRYMQVFGRLLRTFPGKVRGTYLDLVGNVVEHGLPDADREWSLEGKKPQVRTEHDEFALKACVSCFEVFPRFKPACPHCGHRPTPAGRDRPEQVDGDLTEYSPELVARLRGEADRIMRAAPPSGAVPAKVIENWNARAVTQGGLREALAAWGGVQARLGRDEAESYRLFWHRFGVDVMTARTLGAPEARELMDKLWCNINEEYR